MHPSLESRTPMRSTPPRRSRRPPPSDGGGIPLVPLLLGVIVLGFVIGAGLSIAGRRNANVAYSTPTPVQSLPSQLVTPAPTEKPTPEPTEGPTEAPAVEPSSAATRAVAQASPSARRSATPQPSVEPSATPSGSSASAKPKTAAVATRAPKETPLATAAPAATQEAASATPLGTHPPHVVATKAPQAATAVPVANAPADASTDFTRLAAAVVRQYLAAVSRGDEESAYAALGGSPGDRGVQLTEAGIVDAHTKIGKVEAHGAGNAATVNVDLQTPDGVYYGQYTVRRNETGAAVIVQHSIAK